MSLPLILSAYTVEPFLNAVKKGASQLDLSPDLGLTKIPVAQENDDFILLDSIKIKKHIFLKILEEKQSCFRADENGLEKIAIYSEQTNRYYSLYPTTSAPTMLLSGIPMHRIKDTDPYKDTLTKIKAAQPIEWVLDTTTGLGYTAIESARTAQRVITIELDPAVIELCKLNPWSKDLFTHPRISQVIGDSSELIYAFPDGLFSRVIHDPPTFSLAGDLYSGEFYAQVYRVLKPKGRLFHYIGDLNSPSGRKVSKGVITRLTRAGFKEILPRPEAFGLLALRR
jgi:uncharacterized protein